MKFTHGPHMLAKYLDPKNDFAFKKIFGTEKNKDILIHFLNDMITFKENSPTEEKMEVARKMIREKVDLSIITTVTGMSADQIKSISP
jgi:uncharacterized protein YerC